ncbi:unnamed protein product [Allacma fusca]|uniref:CUB domain-containing protein n=1 Tax=Allacma fusca TaxID=39272 RepID=A0A8J2LK57_9HEXA|nr:unnamed protein product [Allacma fusca]
MAVEIRHALNGLLTSVLFLWVYSVFVASPVVNGQWETPNHLCGGIFRSVNGTIDFKYNASTTNPDPTMKKVCQWTIIPSPFQKYIEVTIQSHNLNCNANDRLGFTAFQENTTALQTDSFCTVNSPRNMTGSVVVVTLMSNTPVEGSGFVLRWRSTVFFPRIRFVTAYYSYGQPSIAPLPYFAAGFTGNSLSTFGFPMGNRTVGYSLQMRFSTIELLGRTDDNDENCPGRVQSDCSVLLICKVNDDATLEQVGRYSTNVTDVVHTNKNGLFLIMWGGNYYNARGGGKMQLTYTSVRD